MSYKLGLLLSLSFMMAVLLLAGDLLNVSIVENNLNALGLTISHRIAMDGRLTPESRNLIDSYGARYVFEDGEKEIYRIGATVSFTLQKDYDPFVLSKGTMTITVRRSTVVGYYQR